MELYRQGEAVAYHGPKSVYKLIYKQNLQTAVSSVTPGTEAARKSYELCCKTAETKRQLRLRLAELADDGEVLARVLGDRLGVTLRDGLRVHQIGADTEGE